MNYIGYNSVSDEVFSHLSDVKVVRKINGGTVIIPSFDESCPKDLIGPFTYACKIVEEYMPPCLPIRVKVSMGSVMGSSRKSVSKVLARSIENFGKIRIP